MCEGERMCYEGCLLCTCVSLFFSVLVSELKIYVHCTCVSCVRLHHLCPDLCDL